MIKLRPVAILCSWQITNYGTKDLLRQRSPITNILIWTDAFRIE
jgi:hypothetical protein